MKSILRRLRLLLIQSRFFLKYPRLFVFARQLKKQGKTYLNYEKMESLIDSVMFVRKRKRGEDIAVAEFGVGRGGSALLLYKLVAPSGGKLWLFDVFGRIPPPSDKDGSKAAARYSEILHAEKPSYYGNIRNLRETIEKELTSVSSKKSYEMVEGEYESLLPFYERKQFDFVHIDCDWYKSVKAVLGYLLAGNLAPFAVLQIDDYGFWEGCKAAVMESGILKHPHVTRGSALVVYYGDPTYRP